MNQTQTQTGAAAIIGILAGYAYGHGWLGLSLTDWTTLITALGTIGAVAWPLVAARAKALKDTVGKMPSTTVITDKATAEALPNNPDVIAATPQLAVAVATAKSQGA